MVKYCDEHPRMSMGPNTRTNKWPQGPITTNNKVVLPGPTNGYNRPQPQLMNGNGCPPQQTAMGLITMINEQSRVPLTTINEWPIAPSTIPQPAPPLLSSLKPLRHIPYISRHNRKTLMTPTQGMQL